jgi:uncharacterized protein GlcG (DUF336 family)
VKSTTILTSVGLLAMAAATGLYAQAPAPAGPGMAPMPAAAGDGSDTMLPGDRIMRGPPPGGGPGGPGGPPPGGRPPPEAGTNAAGPTLALALEAAQAALAACKADGYNIGVSVVDSTGEPRVTLSADGATGGHVYTGVRKALAALAFQVPSGQAAAKIAADPAAAKLVTPKMATMAGAVPLVSGGKVIGAIGASGASSGQDEKCAIAGAEKIKARL